jgi:hypothetical protein
MEPRIDAWILTGIPEHRNISISSDYVHPSEDSVLTAIANRGGHKFDLGTG